ncbi:MAG: preprotein translocase subunit SecG [Isosphaeraceae bacterium]
MAFFIGLLNFLLILSSVFLICLILIQRGKGGGLAGAFGGMGGSSAFGTKAGDVFTRVTIGIALVWIILNMLLVVLHNRPHSSAFQGLEAGAPANVPSTATPPAGVPAPIPSGPGPTNPPPTTPQSGRSSPASPSGLPSALDDLPAPTTPPAKTP